MTFAGRLQVHEVIAIPKAEGLCGFWVRLVVAGCGAFVHSVGDRAGARSASLTANRKKCKSRSARSATLRAAGDRSDGAQEASVSSTRRISTSGGRKGKHGASKTAQDLVTQGRANFVAAADYADGSSLDQIVKAIISKVAADCALSALRKAA